MLTHRLIEYLWLKNCGKCTLGNVIILINFFHMNVITYLTGF